MSAVAAPVNSDASRACARERSAWAVARSGKTSTMSTRPFWSAGCVTSYTRNEVAFVVHHVTGESVWKPWLTNWARTLSAVMLAAGAGWAPAARGHNETTALARTTLRERSVERFMVSALLD